MKLNPHPNVLEPIGYCHEDQNLVIVSKFMENGSMKEFLERQSWSLSLKERLALSIGAANGLIHLHSLSPPIGYGPHFSTNKILVDEVSSIYLTFQPFYFFLDKFIYNSKLILQNFTAKLTGYGLMLLRPPRMECRDPKIHLILDNSNLSYIPPEYISSGN